MTANWNLDWVQGVGANGAGWMAIALLIAWLLAGEPLAGRRAWRSFKAATGARDGAARRRFYVAWSLQGWVLAAITLVLALGILGWSPDQLGLRAPRLQLAHFGGGFVLGAGAAAIAGFLAGAWLAKRRAAPNRGTEQAPPRVTGDILAMLPRDGAERRRYALLAVTAGITEEIVWRGFLLAVLVAVFPAAPAWLLLAPMALVFGWAHLYQGASGVLVTAILGGALAGIYIATASLLIPMALHVRMGLGLMLLPAPRDNAG